MAQREPTAAEVAEARKKLSDAIVAHDIHPVVKAAAFLVQDENGKFWPDQLPAEHVSFIKAVLDAAEADGHIKDAVLDLATFAASLNLQPESKRMAQHLYALCEVTVHEKKLLGVELSLEEIHKAQALVGKGETAKPQMVGEKPPAGSFKGASLAPKRRI